MVTISEQHTVEGGAKLTTVTLGTHALLTTPRDKPAKKLSYLKVRRCRPTHMGGVPQGDEGRVRDSLLACCL